MDRDYDVVLAEYKTVRAYLDVKQRVAVLNQRLGVLQVPISPVLCSG